MGVEIRRGTARFLTRGEGLLTRHSLSFGEHYDPDNVRFGALVCHDDHLLRAGVGFDDHPHRDVVIVTWVLTGTLRHSHVGGDSEVHAGEVRPGQVQVLSAGSGVTHAEVAGPGGPARFVQAWLATDGAGTPPTYSITDVDLRPGELTVVARFGADTTFRVARLETGDSITLPDDPLVHVFVAGGALTRSSMAEPLADGDAFRITRAEGEESPGLSVTAAVPTELLVWSFVSR